MYLWMELFLAFLFTISAASMLVLRIKDARSRVALQRALVDARPEQPVAFTNMTLETGLSHGGPLQQAVAETPWLRAIAEALGRVRWGQKTGTIVSAMAGMAPIGYLAGTILQAWLGGGAIPLAIGGFAILPLLHFRRKESKRLNEFEAQLPDALDFLARSVRTGNALSVSLENLVRETAEPLKAEFQRVAREQALGSSLETALKHLLDRMPLIELRFFVAAVLLQRETGGNLAEVLNKLSVSVRERLRIKGQVKASSAQGRLTARVLSVLPMAVILMMNVISPAYFHVMTNDPVGRMMLLAAVISQLVGYYCMRRITSVEV